MGDQSACPRGMRTSATDISTSSAKPAPAKLDRYLDFHYFTNEAGGNMMMFMNLIWAWGHPEVYILILPAFGVFSEVVSTMVGLSALGAYATFVVFAWRDKDEYNIPAETVARIDRANRSARSVVLARRQATP